MEQLVTLFTPVYNHEKYLDDYFKSIINQTYENIELVIIDDCSTDKSNHVIEKWLDQLESRFVRVVYISRDINKGLIFNCNQGIELSRGKYLHLFASDDLMDPNNIKYKVEYLEKNEQIAFVYSDGFIVNEHFTYKDCSNTSKSKFSDVQTLHEGMIFQKLIDYGCFIPGPTPLVRRDVLLETEGYSTDYMFEDYQMWLKISKKYEVGVIQKPLIYYRLLGNSLSRSVDSFRKMIKDHEKLLYDIQSQDGDIDISKGLQKVYKDAAIGFFKYDFKEDFLYYYRMIINKNLHLKLRFSIIHVPIFYKIFKWFWIRFKAYKNSVK